MATRTEGKVPAAEHFAREAGRAGRPIPSYAAGVPRLEAAHRAGLAEHRPVAFGPPVGTPSRPPARRDANTRPASTPAARRPGYASRAFSPARAATRVGAGPIGRVSRAGDGGGLLLALIVYPVVLATVKYGASGPGLWFRAKWLNQPAGQPTGQPGSGSAAPAPPVQAPSGIGAPAAPSIIYLPGGPR